MITHWAYIDKLLVKMFGSMDPNEIYKEIYTVTVFGRTSRLSET
jgi:hypothetical protein